MFGIVGCRPVGDRRRVPARVGVLVAALVVLLASSVAAGAIGTPKRGPLSKQPTIPRHSGPPPRRLVIRDVVHGTGRRAWRGGWLTVNYVGALYHGGTVFDSSWSRHEQFTFPLGRGDVIPGWEKGLAGMRVGERRELIIPPALAYGRHGSPPKVPPNATLVFVVDLLAVERTQAAAG